MKRTYTKRDIINFLVDCLGYGEDEAKDMTFKEALWIINDNGHLLNFAEFTE